MKIRIKGNTIRYRLSQGDVEQLRLHGIVEERTVFADKTLTYILMRTTKREMSASFKNNTITMLMPMAMALEMTETEKVGFEGTDGQLSLYIEKDFKCLDNVAEDQSDNYPNPLAQQKDE